MKQMLNILEKKNTQILPPLSKNPEPIIHRRADSNGHGFDANMNPTLTNKSSSSKISDLSRKRLQNNGEMIMGGPPNPQFFHGVGDMRESSPTSVSNAITEIDVNSDKYAQNQKYTNPAVNNLMGSSQGSFLGSQHPNNKQVINQQKKDYVNSWGVQGEESKKILEARYMKNIRRKNKKKAITADDRLKQFRRISRKNAKY